MAIVVDGGGVALLFAPNLRHMPECFGLGNHAAGSIVTMRSRRPGGESGVKEERMFKPGVFKAKNGGFGDVGGGCDEEGDMIRSGTGTVRVMLGNMELMALLRRARSSRARVGDSLMLLQVNCRSRRGSSSKARESMQKLKKSASERLKAEVSLSEEERSKL